MMKKYSFVSVRTDGLILILGLGQTGLAAALWCASHGARLRVMDTRLAPPGLDTLRGLAIPADIRLGPDALVPDALRDVRMLVLSPGLNPRLTPVARFLAQARENGIEILGEMELFARALADMRKQGYAPRLAAVTGTNGKTTVASLLRRLVQACGHSVRAAGNIGPAALASLQQAMAQDELPDVWVLELSSFQLVTTASLYLEVAAVLNVSQDHLDWHGSLQAYAAAKARLLTMSEISVINRDDPMVCAMVSEQAANDVRSYGQQRPQLQGDLGLEEQQGLHWLVLAPDYRSPEPGTARRRNSRSRQRLRALVVQPLMPVDDLQVHGRHNVQNVLAALALGLGLDLPLAPMLHSLRTYRGEPHRTQLVRSVAGIAFIDDSKGTNVGATLAALQGLGNKVILIAGGVGKGQDFTPLVDAVRTHARAVLLIGQDAPLLASVLSASGIPLERCESLEQAVARSFELAQAGDAVLLSPACASTDMFRNYVHRSACFVSAVNALATEHGEPA